MAFPDNEVNKLRERFTRLSEEFMLLNFELQRYGDFGRAFYDAYLTDADGNPTTDISAADFHTACATLAAMAQGLTQGQRLAIAKMRR
jgi:hypothetical protein